jgi:hypothetical protein
MPDERFGPVWCQPTVSSPVSLTLAGILAESQPSAMVRS